jgi:hypothetical protein
MPDVPSKIYTWYDFDDISYLDDGSLTGDFENLTLSDRAISESHVNDLSVSKRKIEV